MTTSPRQVLVHLDPTRATPARLAAARRIAGEQGAALCGLYAVIPAFMELPYAPGIGPSAAADLVALDEERRARTHEAFQSAMAGPGAVGAWAQTDEVPVTSAFAQQALFADLLVLGQHEPGDAAARTVPPDFVESVLVASGRPAVVLPYVGWDGPVGETIAIAWKETPEAARAVSAALPFLQRARQVHILSWGDAQEPAVGGHALDLAGYLGQHGVTAQWHRGGPEPEAIGELLLSRAFDLSADLLVMGCYGHSRAREWVLGGASRTLLRAMTLPVLMAH
jgi:nucleotide-binding universal stress UspA family protein